MIKSNIGRIIQKVHCIQVDAGARSPIPNVESRKNEKRRKIIEVIIEYV